MTDVNLKTTGLFFLLFSLSVSSIAQEQQPRASFSHMAYLSAGRSNFDEEIAEQEGIEDDAATFRLAWMAQKNALIVGAGMGVFVYSDNQGFSQRVRSDYGSDYQGYRSMLSAFFS